MKVLFFIEPLPELGRPKWKKPWLYFVNDCIRGFGNAANVEFHCVVGEPLRRDAEHMLPHCQVSSIDFHDLVPRFGNSALEVASGWYQGDQTDEDLAAMASLFTEELLNNPPDICFSLSPAPFLKSAFPNSLVFYRELGMLSRFPFPVTSYIDPCGMFSGSALIKFAEEIRNFAPTDMELEFVNELKNTYQQRVLEDSPFEDLVERLSSFRKVVLLPLQFSNFYAYDCNAEIKDQFELLEKTLSVLPSDCALMITEHPQHKVLDEETRAYLTERNSNFIWDERFQQYDSLSLLLMPYIDMVVSVSSSVGMQALVWDKQVVVAGSSHLDLVADGFGLENIAAVLADEYETKPQILAWLLTRYYMPEEFLFDEGLIAEYVDFHRDEKGFSAFKPLTDLDKLREFYKRNCLTVFDEHWVNRMRSPSYAEAQKLREMADNFEVMESSLAAFKLRCRDQEELLDEAEKKTKQMSSEIEERVEEIEALMRQVSDYEKERQHILSSFSWRMTAPLRDSLDFVKRIVGKH